MSTTMNRTNVSVRFEHDFRTGPDREPLALWVDLVDVGLGELFVMHDTLTKLVARLDEIHGPSGSNDTRAIGLIQAAFRAAEHDLTVFYDGWTVDCIDTVRVDPR